MVTGESIQSQEIGNRRRFINYDIERGKLHKKFLRTIRRNTPSLDNHC
jgi:hypothetical protein